MVCRLYPCKRERTQRLIQALSFRNINGTLILTSWKKIVDGVSTPPDPWNLVSDLRSQHSPIAEGVVV
jgi:hypothetical protein